MPRDLPIGNGNILVAFDKDYRLREFYFPHVGEENHTKGEPFRFGVFTDGQFSWIPEGWQLRKEYLDDSLITNVELSNPSQNLRIFANDMVDFHENLYLKKLIIENMSDREKEVRLFLAQDFHIYGNEIGDTAEFRPENNSLLHYKQERYFLINVYANSKYGIETFATGNKQTGAFEGTWKDAEDGILSENPIAQGSVDSVIGITLKLKPKEKQTCFYWICVGTQWEEVKTLNEIVKKKGPELFLNRTLNYWKLWVNKEPLKTTSLPDRIVWLYKKSLLIARTQINNCGSIISANDSDVMYFNRDTYSYMWPRDGALTAYALDLAGYGITIDFYNFCNKVIEKKGYFLHKYTPTGSLASSWHPWLKEKKPQLPIQEDETALVIWALWKHYLIFRDIEFIKPLYKTLIKRSADFMMNYRDEKTGLPLPSYDLWEERQGILTFTVSTVIGGLIASANFTEAFGEKELADEYRKGAQKMRDGMDRYLYLENEKRFARMINFNRDGSVQVDPTIDASLYGTFAFGAYLPDDEKVKNTMDQISTKLWCNPSGGVARYENDSYYRVDSTGPGNPWFITTLWLAQYYIAVAKEKKDLEKPLSILQWVADHALPSGVLAEQINPNTQEPLSVSPLTWSHATYITVVQEYLNKYAQIEIKKGC
jgi:oligosaccharide amylase